MKTDKVHIHIDRLVFDGFTLTPVQRTALVSAAQTELGRLLAGNGLGQRVSGFATPSIDAGLIQHASPSVDPASFGRQLAQALYGGLRGQTE